MTGHLLTIILYVAILSISLEYIVVSYLNRKFDWLRALIYNLILIATINLSLTLLLDVANYLAAAITSDQLKLLIAIFSPDQTNI